MRKLVLLSTVLFATPFTMNMSYGQCVNTLDCQALGYNKTSCQNGGVKCPTGNYWYCPKDCEEGYVFINGKCQKKEIEWGNCTGLAQNCKIGDVLYSDGTCSAQRVSGKTPVGVVTFIDGICGYALALKDAGLASWSTILSNVGAIKDVVSDNDIRNDFKSCENTEAMLAMPYASSNYPSATIARNFEADGVPETKGKWCLPSIGVLYQASQNKDKIDAGLSNAGGVTFDGYYWSSSEYSAEEALQWSYRENYYPYTTYKPHTKIDYIKNYPVRSVMRF